MRKLEHGDEAERVAAAAFGWLAADEDRLWPFLQASGLAPGDVRAVAGEPGFLASVLDHVMGEETLLRACAEALDIRPERIAAAWQKLRPPDFDHSA